jgi:Putative Zn-dependent protease, contains TPR repeats
VRKKAKDEKSITKETSLAEGSDKDVSLTQGNNEPSESVDEEESFPEYFQGEIYTETMADIYMSQGLYKDAIEIFERLIKQDPGNDSLRKKLNQAKTYILSRKAGRLVD